MKIRYIVAHSDVSEATGFLAGIASNQPYVSGWYLRIYDDEGREGFIGGPCDTAEAALLQHSQCIPATPGGGANESLSGGDPGEPKACTPAEERGVVGATGAGQLPDGNGESTCGSAERRSPDGQLATPSPDESTRQLTDDNQPVTP